MPKFKLNIVFLLLADESKSENEKDENRQREIKKETRRQREEANNKLVQNEGLNAKNHYTVNRCVQVVSETNSSGSDIFADSSKTFSDDDSVFDASSQDSLGRVQQRYGAINRLENDSVEEPEQVQERIRLERIESAMKDEGAAVWSM